MKSLLERHGDQLRKFSRNYILGQVKPVLEYDIVVWATAAASSVNQINIIQNQGMLIITEGMETMPINELEKFIFSQSRTEEIAEPSNKQKNV